MAKKVVEGWRNKRNQDAMMTGVAMIDGLLDIGVSHDGWSCPHCNFEDDMYRAYLNNQDYIQLMNESYHDPLERECEGCGKRYFLKAHVVIKYSTCADKEFADE